ncbi:MAG: hypothetical protein IJF05_01520 [Clostridia bacterium]|nr:hypothetical protein [Clostridia bacterium]
MKKFLLLLLVACLAFTFVACKPDNNDDTPPACTSCVDNDRDGICDNEGCGKEVAPVCTEHVDANVDGVCDNEGCGAAVEINVMNYAEYAAAELNTFVVVDAYVQAHQSWWDNKITVYLADEDGAYFAYEMACSEEDAAKLTKGTKIRVYGYKGEWSGEIEIMDCAFYFLDANDTYVATAVDLTDKLGTDELANYQNRLARFTDMTVALIEYQNGEPGKDIYVTLEKNGAQYGFCVESYLTGTSTDLYKLFTQGTLSVGDVIDVECFVYWYNGMNPHVIAITNINE